VKNAGTEKGWQNVTMLFAVAVLKMDTFVLFYGTIDEL